nr:calmodulin [Gammaproteobacteria bacterium]
MRQLGWLIVLAAALGMSTAAVAAQADQLDAKFQELDKDSNGKVSINEASEDDDLFIAFESLDKDRDGELTKEEFASYRAAKE